MCTVVAGWDQILLTTLANLTTDQKTVESSKKFFSLEEVSQLMCGGMTRCRRVIGSLINIWCVYMHALVVVVFVFLFFFMCVCAVPLLSKTMVVCKHFSFLFFNYFWALLIVAKQDLWHSARVSAFSLISPR